MRERERCADQRGDHDAGAAGRDAVQRREREEGEVHAEDLRVHAEATPDVAVVLEAVAVAPREERSRGRADGRREVGEADAPHRPEDGERKDDQEDVADEIEERPQRDEAEGQLAESDDDQMWKVLVVEELREAELELRDPEVERVLAAAPSGVGLLDEEDMLGVVVDIWDRDGHLGKKREGVEGHRDRDERDQRESSEAREAQIERDRITWSAKELPVAPDSRKDSEPRAWDRDAAPSRARSAHPRSARAGGRAVQG